MNNDNVSKRNLWQYVNRKINRVIHHYHVFAVITILFEEMIKDLIRGRDIKIHNFGTLTLKDMKPRKYHNVVYRQVRESGGSKLLRFIIAPALRKKMTENLDIAKKDEQHE